MQKYITILQTGQPIAHVLNKYGNFDQLFINAMGLDMSYTKTIRVYEDLNFPHPNKIAGILITGSPAMVTEGNDWCLKTQQWLKQFLDTKLPILGVCYGHQLLATVLGGKVQWNPKGREIGQVDMQLMPCTKNDKLLGHLYYGTNASIKLQATHQQAVIELPKKIPILGKTKLDSHHCFCYKNHIWGLQFHPEFTPDIIKDYIRLRYDDIQNEGLNPDEMIANVKNLNNGTSILKNFAELCLNN